MINISVNLQVYIWPGKFHGILRSPSITAWEFSFNIEAKKSELLLEMLASVLDPFLNMVVCILENRRPDVVLQVAHQISFSRLFLPFEHLNLISECTLVPLLSYLCIHVK